MLRRLLLTGASALALSGTAADAKTYLTPGDYVFTAPTAGVYSIYAEGGAGGSFAYIISLGDTAVYNGGSGGFATGDFTLTRNEVLDVTVGGAGVPGSYNSYIVGSPYNSAGYGHDSLVRSSGATLVGGYGGYPAYEGSNGGSGSGFVAYQHNGVYTTNTAYGGGSNTGAGQVVIAELSATGVPEPSVWSLMLGGFGLIGYKLRRRFTQGGPTTTLDLLSGGR